MEVLEGHMVRQSSMYVQSWEVYNPTTVSNIMFLIFIPPTKDIGGGWGGGVYNSQQTVSWYVSEKFCLKLLPYFSSHPNKTFYS